MAVEGQIYGTAVWQSGVSEDLSVNIAVVATNYFMVDVDTGKTQLVVPVEGDRLIDLVLYKTPTNPFTLKLCKNGAEMATTWRSFSLDPALNAPHIRPTKRMRQGDTIQIKVNQLA